MVLPFTFHKLSRSYLVFSSMSSFTTGSAFPLRTSNLWLSSLLVVHEVTQALLRKTSLRPWDPVRPRRVSVSDSHSDYLSLRDIRFPSPSPTPSLSEVTRRQTGCGGTGKSHSPVIHVLSTFLSSFLTLTVTPVCTECETHQHYYPYQSPVDSNLCNVNSKGFQ